MLQKWVLKRTRIDPNGVLATLGHLSRDGLNLFVTLELPKHDNEHGKSCIPAGIYTAVRFHSPTHGDVFLLLDVPGRDAIEIHVGNFLFQTKGCILIGMEFGNNAVWHSVAALEEFMLLNAGLDKIEIEVIDG